jgi:NAD-dependent deacetylase
MSIIEDARVIVKNAIKLTVLTGAQISKESGVDVFQNEGVSWSAYPPGNVATARAFKKNPKFVWDYYNELRKTLSSVEPNAAHVALSKLERSKSDFTLITQNVDGLHKKAGSKNIIELCGNIWQTRCTGCWDIKENKSKNANVSYCSECGKLLRPNVKWFDEKLELGKLSLAKDAALCDLMIVAGSSGLMEQVAGLARYAKEGGAKVLEIGEEKTILSELADIIILGRLCDILPQIV